MKAVNLIAWILVTIGAINWGLVALMKTDLVTTIFTNPDIANIVYIIIGVAGVYQLIPLSKCLTGKGEGCCGS